MCRCEQTGRYQNLLCSVPLKILSYPYQTVLLKNQVVLKVSVKVYNQYHFFLHELSKFLSIHLYRKDALKQGSLRSHSPIVSARIFRLHLTVCSLFAIYRCVTRSCHRVVNKNCYHRKLSGMPRLSRYSCRDFSRSSSVDAVFDCVYNCRFTIRSTFSISPSQIR